MRCARAAAGDAERAHHDYVKHNRGSTPPPSSTLTEPSFLHAGPVRTGNRFAESALPSLSSGDSIFGRGLSAVSASTHPPLPRLLSPTSPPDVKDSHSPHGAALGFRLGRRARAAQAIDLAFVDRADIKQYIGLPSLPARYQVRFSEGSLSVIAHGGCARSAGPIAPVRSRCCRLTDRTPLLILRGCPRSCGRACWS